jgi:hypothetical protein
MFSDLGGSAGASASAADAAAGLEPPPRMACALCRRRKLRCNRQLPCDSCTRLGFDCLYSEASRTPPAARRPRALPPDGRSGTFPRGAAPPPPPPPRRRSDAGQQAPPTATCAPPPARARSTRPARRGAPTT